MVSEQPDSFASDVQGPTVYIATALQGVYKNHHKC